MEIIAQIAEIKYWKILIINDIIFIVVKINIRKEE